MIAWTACAILIVVLGSCISKLKVEHGCFDSEGEDKGDPTEELTAGNIFSAFKDFSYWLWSKPIFSLKHSLAISRDSRCSPTEFTKFVDSVAFILPLFAKDDSFSIGVAAQVNALVPGGVGPSGGVVSCLVASLF